MCNFVIFKKSKLVALKFVFLLKNVSHYNKRCDCEGLQRKRPCHQECVPRGPSPPDTRLLAASHRSRAEHTDPLRCHRWTTGHCGSGRHAPGCQPSTCCQHGRPGAGSAGHPVCGSASEDSLPPGHIRTCPGRLWCWCPASLCPGTAWYPG